jgi:hypothetical protein
LKLNQLAAILVAITFSAFVCRGQETASISRLRRDWNNAKPLSWEEGIDISSLPASQRAAIGAALRQWFRQISRTGDSEEHADEGNVSIVELGSPNRKQLVRRGTGQFDCSPTGNCSFQVLQPVQTGYRVILDSIGQTFTIMPGRTKHYHDILVGMHGSATLMGVQLYKFDGLRYKRGGCFNAEFQGEDENGSSRELDEPRITPCRSQ